VFLQNFEILRSIAITGISLFFWRKLGGTAHLLANDRTFHREPGVISYFSTLIFRSIALQSFSRILAMVLCWKLGGAMLEAHPISPQNDWLSSLALPFGAALVATSYMGSPEKVNSESASTKRRPA
jgi:hypothetical protein